MKRFVLAIAVTLGAMTAASAQSPSGQTGYSQIPSPAVLKACTAKVNAEYPLALGQNVSDGGLFLYDRCIHGEN